MMRKRIQTYINLLLIVISGVCIWYLSTAEYWKPNEIRKMENFLSQGETSFNLDLETDYGNSHAVRVISKRIMQELYTPTPTPTPAPKPTPKPPNLRELVHAWQLTSIDDERTVQIYDDREKRDFTMTIGGLPVSAKDKKGNEHSVRLVGVDMTDFKIMLQFGQQKHALSMF